MIFSSFEPFPLQLKKQSEKTWIWCPIRSKWLVLTSEEWVRQQWIQYFLSLNYPKGWIVSEYSLNYQNKKNIRLDLALFNENEDLVLLAEFKKLDYKITTKDLEQALRYASIFQPRYIMLSNYKQTFIWNVQSKEWNVVCSPHEIS